jgi:hypothetical protein
VASRFLLDRRFGAATTTVSGRARDVSGSTWREGEPGTPLTVVSLAGRRRPEAARRAGLEVVEKLLQRSSPASPETGRTSPVRTTKRNAGMLRLASRSSHRSSWLPIGRVYEMIFAVLPRLVTGPIHAGIQPPLRTGVPCVRMGWSMSQEGRKFIGAGSSLPRVRSPRWPEQSGLSPGRTMGAAW